MWKTEYVPMLPPNTKLLADITLQLIASGRHEYWIKESLAGGDDAHSLLVAEAGLIRDEILKETGNE